MSDIWVLNHYATPPDTSGITRHYDFSRELQKCGCRVTIFASGFNHRTRREERLTQKQYYRRETVGGVDFIWIRTLPYYKGNDWRRSINMLSYAICVFLPGIKLQPRPDVIWASSPHPFNGLAGYILAKIKGARFVFEVRDLWPQTLIDIGGYNEKGFLVRFLRILEKFLYKHASKIIVLVPNAIDYIKALGIPYEKIIYIPNGIDPELYADTSTKLPNDISKLISTLKAGGKFLVGYAGAHGIANALETIIEAAHLFHERGNNEVHFLMAGGGPEKEKMVYKSQCYGLTNISFCNSIPKAAIPTLLRSFDIALVTSRKSSLYRYGTSVNKLLDYMACSRPIIWATNSVNDLVNEADCGLTVPPEDPEEVAKAIMELRSLSDARRQDIGKKGYDYVMKYYTVPVLAAKLTEALGVSPIS